MRLIFVIFLSLFFLASCKKGKSEVTLRGVITDQTFNLPFSGAKVYLYENEASSTQPKLIGEMNLGSDGAYSFTFPRNQVLSYTVRVEKINYFTLDKTILFSELTIEEDNVRNYSTTALSWVKLRFFNQSPLSNDILKYNKNVGKSDCIECCPDGDVFLYGAVDTTIYCYNDGNTTYSYFYIVEGTADQGYKSATTVAFDTTEIFLNY